ncbi:alpha/beta hydrolase [Herbaspirillum sp. RTI4]|uniref:YheT family hydrolase n=1 Tax=Herbaspirillum sp. RTI4 TaxID=3048640 RepID=UPI002AB511C4|nr:alpha/beta fold hydrolase [Herbaspirillum sp. RTI4]MDY7576803.1 alpha/beta hydrolase [Herbaspirillum sp. RTI4]MEA9981399.1 alpha/beta hydrolase [Herbaspirillum sp. RTI4]
MLYQAPRWLPGGHLQTIFAATCIAKPPVAYRRERWDAPDGDFIDVDFVDGLPGKPLVVLFHGLEGSSDSHYSRALMAQVAQRGWSGAVPHFRGCSGTINLAPRFYHSGDTQEVDWILRRLAERQQPGQHLNETGKLYACGVSLGGNALLRWLGESQHSAEFIAAACSVSAPLNLAGGGEALGRGFSRVYTRSFLRTLHVKCLRKLEQFPGLFDRETLLQTRDLHAFDDLVTAPLHGYRDADDYWDRASACHVLGDITVPTLVLNAQNDPFLPARYLPATAAPAVTLEYPMQGGHVGFPVGTAPGRIDWLPQRLLQFLETH